MKYLQKLEKKSKEIFNKSYDELSRNDRKEGIGKVNRDDELLRIFGIEPTNLI